MFDVEITLIWNKYENVLTPNLKAKVIHLLFVLCFIWSCQALIIIGSKKIESIIKLASFVVP